MALPASWSARVVPDCRPRAAGSQGVRGPDRRAGGDAGNNEDCITAQEIQGAFLDTELCVTAVDEAFSGPRPFDHAMRDYRSARDQHVLPMYEFTADLASLDPPSPEIKGLLTAMCGNQQAMEGARG
jgi:hypothetical protein